MNTRLILPLAGIIAILVLITSLMSTCNKNKRLEQQLAEKESIIAAQQDTTRYYVNAYNQEVATRRVAEARAEELAKAGYNLEEIARRFNTQVNNLKQYVEIASRGQSNLKPEGGATVITKPKPNAQPGKDTCQEVIAMEQTFSNNYYRAQVRVGDSAYHILDAWDTTYVGFKYTPDKYGFLKLRTRYIPEVSVVNANPDIRNTIVRSFNTATTRIQPHRWAISGFVGWTYPLRPEVWKQPANALKREGEFRIGVGISRNIISLR